MKYISRYIVLIIAFLGLTTVLPSLYRVAFADYKPHKSVTFSPVVDDFFYVSVEKNVGVRYTDAAGNEYSKVDYYHAKPFLYARNLVRWGTYPTLIAGKYIPADEVTKSLYFFGIRPKRVDIELNRIPLYPLYESSGEFTQLEIPNDLFRINDRMEFISGMTRGVDSEKSELFTSALTKAGFSFPAQGIFGNTNPKKPYDFGYFAEDAKGDIFHIKQLHGKPFVRNTNKPAGADFEYISVAEDYANPSYGVFVTESGDVYRLEKNGYEYKRFDVGQIDVREQYLRVFGDPLYTYVTVRDKDKTEMYVFHKDDTLYKKHTVEAVSSLSPFFEAGYDAVFPFTLRTFEPKAFKHHLYLEPSERVGLAVMFSAVLAMLYAGIMMFRRKSMKMAAVDSIFVLIGGLIPFVLLLLMGSERRR